MIDILVEKNDFLRFLCENNYLCKDMEHQDVLHNISIPKFKNLFPDMPGTSLGDDIQI